MYNSQEIRELIIALHLISQLSSYKRKMAAIAAERAAQQALNGPPAIRGPITGTDLSEPKEKKAKKDK